MSDKSFFENPVLVAERVKERKFFMFRWQMSASAMSFPAGSIIFLPSGPESENRWARRRKDKTSAFPKPERRGVF